MEQRECPSCGLANMPGVAACQNCGAALAPVPYADPVAVVTAPPRDTVVVQRRGMSQPAMLLTALATLVALLIGGYLVFQLGRSSEDDGMTARERSDANRRRTSDTDFARPAPTAPATSAPVSSTPVVTVPAPVSPLPPAAVAPPATSPAADAQAKACAKYVSDVDALLEEWNRETAGLATSAPLEPTLARLRKVERAVSRLSPPACAGRAHGHLVSAITATLNAVESAPAGSDVRTSAAYIQAEELFDRFEVEYDVLKTAAR